MVWLIAGLVVLWADVAAVRLVVLRGRVDTEAARLTSAKDGEQAIAAQRHDDRAFAFNRARRQWWAWPALPLVAPKAATYLVIQSWASGVETASQLSRSSE